MEGQNCVRVSELEAERRSGDLADDFERRRISADSLALRRRWGQTGDI